MSAMCTRILGVSCGVIPDDWLLALVLVATPNRLLYSTVLRVLSYSTVLEYYQYLYSSSYSSCSSTRVL
jgi:hypothetical protein